MFMDQSKPAISVVLPVYGVAKYLGTCIKMLQAQTLKNLEFIFVDDCGPDNSLEIIKKYAETDSRIKIIKNVHNMGAGATRNKGINFATGEFISFVDPDDWMDPDFYEILYSNALSGDFDIVKGRRISVVKRKNGEVRYIDDKQNDDVINATQSGLPLYSSYIHGHQCAIFRLSMIKNHNAHYSNTSFGECGMFILTACCHTNKVCFVEGANYYYLQHEDSSAHSLKWEKYESELKAIFEQMEYAKDELPCDAGLNRYLFLKLKFLVWRFTELKNNRSLAKYRITYIKAIYGELKKLNEKRLIPYLFSGTLLPSRVHSWIETRLKKLHRNKRATSVDYKFLFTDNREIAYLQNHRGSVFFSKRLLDIDYDFATHFLGDFTNGASSYNNNLKKDDDLYQEHLLYSKSNEVCWKYIRRLGHISKSTIYVDENNELWIKGEILDAKDKVQTRNHILLPQPTRKIIPGITLHKYLLNKGENVMELVGELRQFLDYVFERFATEDPDMIEGIAFDACPRNCILTADHTYELYDFEYEYKTPLPKGFFVYLASRQVNVKVIDVVYHKLCEHYNVSPQEKYWNTMISQGWIEIMDNTTDSKYFLK